MKCFWLLACLTFVFLFTELVWTNYQYIETPAASAIYKLTFIGNHSNAPDSGIFQRTFIGNHSNASDSGIFQPLFIENHSNATITAYEMFFKNARPNFNLSNNCPTTGIITIQDSGRLGNQLSQYATLYAYARRDNLVPVITTEMSNTLKKYFTQISLITYEDLGFSCELKVNDITEQDYITQKGVKGNFKFMNNSHNVPLFHPYRHEIIAEFEFKQHYRDEAKDRINKAVGTQDNVTLVGVHVRRTDYKDWMQSKKDGKLVQSGYIRRAMDIYKKKYKKAVFIMISDDMAWCKEYFNEEKDVYLLGDGDPEAPVTDLATFCQCDHSIISQGTFSFWAGYLSGGSTIYPGNYSRKTHYLLRDIQSAHLKDWTMIPAFTPNETQGPISRVRLQYTLSALLLYLLFLVVSWKDQALLYLYQLLACVYLLCSSFQVTRDRKTIYAAR